MKIESSIFRNLATAAGLFLLVVMSPGQEQKAAPKRLLVVTVAIDWGHSSIAPGLKLVEEFARTTGEFTLDFAKTPADLTNKMTAAALKNYDGAFFLCSQGNIPLPDLPAFLDWIKSGKAFIGAHSASDTLRGTPFTEMVGGEFVSHVTAPVECVNDDTNHPATRHLGKSWKVTDEIYSLKNFSRDQVHMLLSLDKLPGTAQPAYVPIAWCKKYGQGNVFYTALGHEDALWATNAAFQQHVLGGIRWALGLEKGDTTPRKPVN